MANSSSKPQKKEDKQVEENEEKVEMPNFEIVTAQSNLAMQKAQGSLAFKAVKNRGGPFMNNLKEKANNLKKGEDLVDGDIKFKESFKAAINEVEEHFQEKENDDIKPNDKANEKNNQKQVIENTEIKENGAVDEEDSSEYKKLAPNSKPSVKKVNLSPSPEKPTEEFSSSKQGKNIFYLIKYS